MVNTKRNTLAVDKRQFAASTIEIEIIRGQWNAIRTSILTDIKRNRAVPVVVCAGVCADRIHGIARTTAVLAGPGLAVRTGGNTDIPSVATLDRNLPVP